METIYNTYSEGNTEGQGNGNKKLRGWIYMFSDFQKQERIESMKENQYLKTYWNWRNT